MKHPLLTLGLVSLTLLATILVTNPAKAPLEEEIGFYGTAIAYYKKSGIGAPTYWTVQVDRIRTGPEPCSSQIDVITYYARSPPPWGYVDPDIKQGDNVEVYGKYLEDQEGCHVILGGSTGYYIRTYTPRPVGGVLKPVNKLEILALGGLIGVSTLVVVKRRSRD